MEESFWRQRWDDQIIGFHRDAVNPALERYADRLPDGARVLVPLAGKSVDMTFLAQRGHPVVGVELVERAIIDYFAERGVTPESKGEGVYAGGGVEAWARDVFDVGPSELGTFEAVYDRAGLIALTPDQRERYARHILSLLAPGGRLLLVTLDYDQAKMSGPPHAVAPEEVERHYAGAATIEVLERRAVIEEEPRFAARGLDWMDEAVYLITRQR